MNNSLLYAITVMIWGSTWIAINFQLGSVAPEVSICYRFALATIILFCFCRLKRLPMAMTIRQHLRLLAFGMTLFGTNYYLLYFAQQHINSALSAIAFSTLMVFNIINARIWFHTKITSKVYLGGALGMIGIVILFWPQINDVELGPQTLLGLMLCLLGVLSASTGNMLSIKNQQDKMPVMQANAWGMLYGALFMAMIAMLQGKSFSFDPRPAYVISLIYLSLFGSVIAFGCYLTLMTRIGAHKTSYANIMFPAVAVLISTLVENFQWTGYTVTGFACILIGNLIVLTRAKIKKPAQSLAPESIASEIKAPAVSN